MGKSWLSLGLALDVAGGDGALGSIPVEAGPVLYLALEDTRAACNPAWAASSRTGARPAG
jgi:RecA-family ATPase